MGFGTLDPRLAWVLFGLGLAARLIGPARLRRRGYTPHYRPDLVSVAGWCAMALGSWIATKNWIYPVMSIAIPAVLHVIGTWAVTNPAVRDLVEDMYRQLGIDRRPRR